jgi:hypothetical protein
MFFFELSHILNPSPLAGYLRVAPFQRQINVGIRQ